MYAWLPARLLSRGWDIPGIQDIVLSVNATWNSADVRTTTRDGEGFGGDSAVPLNKYGSDDQVWVYVRSVHFVKENVTWSHIPPAVGTRKCARLGMNGFIINVKLQVQLFIHGLTMHELACVAQLHQQKWPNLARPKLTSTPMPGPAAQPSMHYNGTLKTGGMQAYQLLDIRTARPPTVASSSCRDGTSDGTVVVSSLYRGVTPVTDSTGAQLLPSSASDDGRVRDSDTATSEYRSLQHHARRPYPLKKVCTTSDELLSKASKPSCVSDSPTTQKRATDPQPTVGHPSKNHPTCPMMRSEKLELEELITEDIIIGVVEPTGTGKGSAKSFFQTTQLNLV
ncbi:hypothetical protein EDC04DRAFT_2976084 [Pisolithus marmoratus]|nr:hypothetical protein EDC04DRAFT_2976084 [Pisolithus marmoratus]